MKKFFLGFMMLGLIGCSSNEDSNLKQTVRDLRESNETLQSDLNSCQAKLDLNPQPAVTVSSEPEVEEVVEPSYEEVDVYVVDGTRCYSSSDPEQLPACGRGFWDCKDGAIRSCMMNVKFKIETEKKLIEE